MVLSDSQHFNADYKHKNVWLMERSHYSLTSHSLNNFLFESRSECHDKSLHSHLELLFLHPNAMQCLTIL